MKNLNVAIKPLFLAVMFAGFVLAGGCDQKSARAPVEKYKYAVILSMKQGGSLLQLYDADGNFLDSKRLKASGVDENGSAYLNGPQYENGKWYIGVASDAKSQDFVLELDPETLNVKDVPANVGNRYQYTGYAVDGDRLYAFYSTPDRGAHIIKSSLSSGKMAKQTEIRHNILYHIIPNHGSLIFLSDSDDPQDPGMYLRIVDGDSLKIEKEFKNPDYLFPRDVLLIHDKLYMVPLLDASERETNQLLIFDLKNENWETVRLPFQNARYLRSADHKLYIFEENTDADHHTMAIMNLKTNEIEDTVTFDYEAKEVLIDKDTMVSGSDGKVYIYDLKTLKLKKAFAIKNADDWMFGSLLVRPE